MNQSLDTWAAFIEEGAALEHARWARWQEHIHDKAVRSGDDNLGIRTLAWPTKMVENWDRQIETEYTDLPESEKESDRREVREYLPLIQKYFIPRSKLKEVLEKIANETVDLCENSWVFKDSILKELQDLIDDGV